MSLIKKDNNRKERRSTRVHAKIRSISTRARLAVFRSSKHFYAQIIDDTKGETLCACSTLNLTDLKGDKKARARAAGIALAKQAQDKGIKAVVFDRGGFLYHGRVQAFADGAREGGLQF